jgi:DNA repair exonuclease SbcCD ATPase subunit
MHSSDEIQSIRNAVNDRQRRLAERLAANDPDDVAIHDDRVAVTELVRQLEHAQTVLATQAVVVNPNAAQPMPDTAPIPPMPPRAYSPRRELDGLIQRARARVARREQLLEEAIAEHARAKTARASFPDAAETKAALTAARGAVEDAQEDLEAARAALEADIARMAAAEPRLDELDQHLALASGETFRRALEPLEAEAREAGQKLGGVARRALDLVQQKQEARRRALRILEELGLPAPRLDELGRSDARRHVALAYRKGLEDSGMNHERTWWTEW